jgi:hypothetical protein
MATQVEVSDKYRYSLSALLVIKKDNQDKHVVSLQEKIRDTVSMMTPEDISWVEGVVGIKAV